MWGSSRTSLPTWSAPAASKKHRAVPVPAQGSAAAQGRPVAQKRAGLFTSAGLPSAVERPLPSAFRCSPFCWLLGCALMCMPLVRAAAGMPSWPATPPPSLWTWCQPRLKRQVGGSAGWANLRRSGTVETAEGGQDGTATPCAVCPARMQLLPAPTARLSVCRPHPGCPLLQPRPRDAAAGDCAHRPHQQAGARWAACPAKSAVGDVHASPTAFAALPASHGKRADSNASVPAPFQLQTVLHLVLPVSPCAPLSPPGRSSWTHWSLAAASARRQSWWATAPALPSTVCSSHTPRQACGCAAPHLVSGGMPSSQPGPRTHCPRIPLRFMPGPAALCCWD